MFKKIIISTVLAGSFLLLPSCGSTRRNTRKEPKFTPRRDYSQSHSHAGATDPLNRKHKKAEVKVQTGAKPAWVDGGSSEFPSYKYLTAVGFAKTRKQAEENARMEMSQIFNTKIKATRDSIKHAHAIRQGGKVKLSEMEFSAETKIHNETESIFAGLELARYWKSDKGTIYVLALIDKARVTPPLKEKINKLDNIIGKLVTEAKNSQDKLARITKLNKALKKAVLREYYNAQIAIMSAHGQTMKTEYDVDTIAHMLDLQLENLSVAVSISGAGNKTIKYAIIKTLGDLGIKVNSDSTTAKLDEFEDFGEDNAAKQSNFSKNTDIVIMGEVSFEALDRGDKYKWVKGSVKLTIKNNNTGKESNAIVINDRIAKWTLQDAKRAVGLSLVKKVMKKLNSNIVSIIGSEK